MNVRIAKEEIALELPSGLSYASAVGDQSYGLPADNSDRRGLGQIVSAFLGGIVRLTRRQAVIDELSSLSDRELADIGLTRSDLPRVFDRSFGTDGSALQTRTARKG